MRTPKQKREDLKPSHSFILSFIKAFRRVAFQMSSFPFNFDLANVKIKKINSLQIVHMNKRSLSQPTFCPLYLFLAFFHQ
jgi:hypothetical protein